MAIIDKPSDYFNTVLYTGNASTPRTITGVGFQPDFVWIKDRSFGYSPIGSDVVRGANKKLSSSEVDAEETNWVFGYTDAFNSDGFSLTTGTSGAETVNGDGDAYVAWNWLAGGTAVSNTDGSITSSVSANTTSGFSIVSYTGTGSAATVGHGLSTAPSIIIIKDRSAVDNWNVYTAPTGNNSHMHLNLTNAASGSSSYWNTTTPTSSVFSLGSSGAVNTSSNNFIAYCFADVKGYSKFGSYTGNGNADGTFVYTGFKPAFVMVKRTDSADNWMMVDNKRGSINLIDEVIFADLPQAEVSTNSCDFLSNGFKARATSTWINASGGSYIYMAFAEQPFTTSTTNGSIPATARETMKNYLYISVNRIHIKATAR